MHMDKKRMRRGWIGIGVLFLISGLTGCGGEYAGMTEGEAASGSAVSSQAVSGDALIEEPVSGGVVNGQPSVEKKRPGSSSYRFATDTNYYSCPYSGIASIWQYRLDSMKKKEISLSHKDVDYFELICVEDGFLYYHIDLENKGEGRPVSKIFRVPLEKDAGGYDVVKMEEKEEILTEAKSIRGCSVYMDSRYLCCLRGEWDKSEFVKYDRKTGKEIPVEALPINVKTDKTVTGYGDRIFVMNMDEICFQKLDETKWHKIDRKEFYRLCYNENAMFDTDVDENGRFTNIYKCDLEKGRWQSYVSIEELEKAARTVIGCGQTEQLECRVGRMFCQGDRLYIETCVIWMEGAAYHVRNLFFYRGEGDDAVCYEKKLSECMHSHAVTSAEEWKNEIKGGREKIVLEDVCCTSMINGKAFLAFYDDKKEEGRMGCYELDTGEFRWLTKEDAEYYEPCYGAMEDWCLYISLFNYEPAGFPSFQNIIVPEGVYVR